MHRTQTGLIRMATANERLQKKPGMVENSSPMSLELQQPVSQPRLSPLTRVSIPSSTSSTRYLARKEYQLEDGVSKRRFVGLSASLQWATPTTLSLKTHAWRFSNSEDNRSKLASFWTVTLFSLDIASSLSQRADQLASLPCPTWGSLHTNFNFLLEEPPESYIERVERASRLVFGVSRKHIVPFGSHSRQKSCVQGRMIPKSVTRTLIPRC